MIGKTRGGKSGSRCKEPHEYRQNIIIFPAVRSMLNLPDKISNNVAGLKLRKCRKLQ